MTLHRDLMRGTGFYNTLQGDGMTEVTELLRAANLEDSEKPARPASLPVLNYLDINHEQYSEFLVEEVLPQDRARFAAYLSARPLGLALVSSPVSTYPVEYLMQCTNKNIGRNGQNNCDLHIHCRHDGQQVHQESLRFGPDSHLGR